MSGGLPNLRTIFPDADSVRNTTLQRVIITHGALPYVAPICDATQYPALQLLDVTGIAGAVRRSFAAWTVPA